MKSMNKRQIMTMIALMLLTAVATFCITFCVIQERYNALLEDLNTRQQEYSKIAEVHDYIDKYYVNDFEEKDVIDGALYGMVAMLGDKWSYYLTAEQFASVINSGKNKIVGIGINASYDEETSSILVLEVYEGSPAEYAKIQRYDRIIKVNGEDVSKLGYEAAVNNITGTADTVVEITIMREGIETPINLSITRREVNIQGVKSKIMPGNIGYIKIANFDLNIDKDVATAITNLKNANVQAIIFDVRNNPGGALNVMVNVLDPLLPEGVIIKEIDKLGNVDVYKSDANEMNIPMAVLVNEHSISAAEFFAASLKEAGKATIVGEATTGKGVAQSQIKLKDGSGLILSVSKYYTGKDVNLAETGGLVPDKVVELTAEEKKKFHLLTEEQDRQLQTAIAVINQTLTPEAPAEQTQPAEAPAEQTQPAEAPAEQTQPAEAPAEQTQPAEAPAEQTQPAEAPAEQTQPAETPAEQAQPAE